MKLCSAAVLMIASGVQAEMKPGSCPDRGQNKPIESFDAYSMAGLWYEYVYDRSYMQNYDYVCSTWIVLNDEAENGPGKYQVYNNMVNSLEEEADEETGEKERPSEFIKLSMNWEGRTDAGQKARAFLMRKDDEDEETVVPRIAMNFIDTDYHQYAVGSTCHEADG